MSLYPVFNNDTVSQTSNEFINIEDTLQNENLEGISISGSNDPYINSQTDIDKETPGVEPYQYPKHLNNRKLIDDRSSAIKVNDAESNPGYGFGENNQLPFLPLGWDSLPWQRDVFDISNPGELNGGVFNNVYDAIDAVKLSRDVWSTQQNYLASPIEWIKADHVIRVTVQMYETPSVWELTIYARYKYEVPDTYEDAFMLTFSNWNGNPPFWPFFMPGPEWQTATYSSEEIFYNTYVNTFMAEEIGCKFDLCTGDHLGTYGSPSYAYVRIVEARWSDYINHQSTSEIHVQWNWASGYNPYFYYDTYDNWASEIEVTRVYAHFEMLLDVVTYTRASLRINNWRSVWHPNDPYETSIGSPINLLYKSTPSESNPPLYNPILIPEHVPRDADQRPLPQPSIIFDIKQGQSFERGDGFYPSIWKDTTTTTNSEEQIDGISLGWKLYQAQQYIVSDRMMKLEAGAVVSEIQWHYGPAYFDYEYQIVQTMPPPMDPITLTIRIVVTYVGDEEDANAYYNEDETSEEHESFSVVDAARDWIVSGGIYAVGGLRALQPTGWSAGKLLDMLRNIVKQPGENIPGSPFSKAVDAEYGLIYHRDIKAQNGARVGPVFHNAALKKFYYELQTANCFKAPSRTTGPEGSGCRSKTWTATYLDLDDYLTKIILTYPAEWIKGRHRPLLPDGYGGSNDNPNRDPWIYKVEGLLPIIAEIFFDKAEWVEGIVKDVITTTMEITVSTIADAISWLKSIYGNYAGKFRSPIYQMTVGVGGYAYFYRSIIQGEYPINQDPLQVEKIVLNYEVDTADENVPSNTHDGGSGSWWDRNGETVVIIVVVVVGAIVIAKLCGAPCKWIPRAPNPIPLMAYSDTNKIPYQFELDDDRDNDGLTGTLEANFGTSSDNIDTDGDGLTDYEEVFLYLTDPAYADTDRDGLLDGDEVNLYGTDPKDTDTDNDGLGDDSELIIWNTDPTDNDSDDDAMHDYQEVITYGTDPNNQDTDGDYLLDGHEIPWYNTNPLLWDTDGDGLSVSDEVWSYNGYVTDPLDPDTDDDTFTDGEELTFGTNPLVWNPPGAAPATPTTPVSGPTTLWKSTTYTWSGVVTTHSYGSAVNYQIAMGDGSYRWIYGANSGSSESFSDAYYVTGYYDIQYRSWVVVNGVQYWSGWSPSLQVYIRSAGGGGGPMTFVPIQHATATVEEVKYISISEMAKYKKIKRY